VPSDSTTSYVLELSNTYIKTPEAYAATSFLREQHPEWLLGAVIKADRLVLSANHDNFSIECAGR